jgi:hypothetical protein
MLTGEGPIRWPGECARCCERGTLREVHVGIARNVTGLLDVLRGRRRYDTLGLHYPVCSEHAAWAAFASWFTRKSPLPNLLRWSGYLFGIPALLLVALRGFAAILALSAWYGGRSSRNPWPAVLDAVVRLVLGVGPAAGRLGVPAHLRNLGRPAGAHRPDPPPGSGPPAEAGTPRRRGPLRQRALRPALRAGQSGAGGVARLRPTRRRPVRARDGCCEGSLARPFRVPQNYLGGSPLPHCSTDS